MNCLDQVNLDVLALLAKAAKVQIRQAFKRDECIDITKRKVSGPFRMSGEEAV